MSDDQGKKGEPPKEPIDLTRLPDIHPTKAWRDDIPTILDLYASGYSLRHIAKAYKANPSHILDYLKHDSLNSEKGGDYSVRYRRAQELRAHMVAEDILEIADSATERSAHAVRVRVEARKWVASKLLPKVYGDKVDVTLGDPDGRALPPRITLNFVGPQGQLEALEGHAMKELPASIEDSEDSE